MSLTTIIAHKGEFGMRYKEILDTLRPKAQQFTTQGGLPAFSSAYPTLVQSRLQQNEATLANSAFVYLASFLTAKHTQIPIDHSSLFFYNAFHHIVEPERKIVIERIKGYFQTMQEFYSSEEINNHFIGHLYTFAKLDQVAKKGDFDEDTDLNFIQKKVSLAIIEDIKRLGNLFKKVFIDSSLITSDSDVIYYPTYSNQITKALRGINADFYFDGVLVDFSTSKSFRYESQDIYRLISLYLFYLIDKSIKATTDLCSEEIEKLAFYKARAGQIEYFDVREMDKITTYKACLDICELFKIKVSANALMRVVSNMH